MIISFPTNSSIWFIDPFQIVEGLGNASIYCQTLSNLYSDPNYQNLNHWSILQTLSRKGAPVTENPDMPLTETVLIRTNPLRIVSTCVASLLLRPITANKRFEKNRSARQKKYYNNGIRWFYIAPYNPNDFITQFNSIVCFVVVFLLLWLNVCHINIRMPTCLW